MDLQIPLKQPMGVNSAFIKKCFRKAGILDRDFNVVRTHDIRVDPFRDLDSQIEEDQSDPELLSLMRQIHGDEHCSFDNFVCDTDSIPTCLDMDNEQWEENFLAELGPPSKQTHSDDSEHEDIENVNALHGESLMPEPVITKYSEAVKALEDVGDFLQRKGHFTEASEAVCLTDKITSLHCQFVAQNARQTTLMQYVNHA